MTSRRSFLAALLAGSLLPLSGRPGRAAAPITLYDPVGANSPMHRALSVIAPPFGEALGTKARVEILQGYPEATRAMLDAPPDGSALMGRTGLGTALAQLREPANAALQRIVPIGKITAGLSVALVVAGDSPIRDFDNFAAAARKERLRIGQFDRASAMPVVAVAMLRRELEAEFQEMVGDRRKDVLAALSDGRVAAAILLTDSLREGDGLRPLCTFGGGRSASLPQVPTLRELTQPKNTAFTAAFGLFGSSALPPARVSRLERALLTAGRRAAAAALQQRVRLDVGGVSLMRSAMERDARIVAALGPWMSAR